MCLILVHKWLSLYYHDHWKKCRNCRTWIILTWDIDNYFPRRAWGLYTTSYAIKKILRFCICTNNQIYKLLESTWATHSHNEVRISLSQYIMASIWTSDGSFGFICKLVLKNIVTLWLWWGTYKSTSFQAVFDLALKDDTSHNFCIELFLIYSTAWQCQKYHMSKARSQKSPVLWPFLLQDIYTLLERNYMGLSGVHIVWIRNRYFPFCFPVFELDTVLRLWFWLFSTSKSLLEKIKWREGSEILVKEYSRLLK